MTGTVLVDDLSVTFATNFPSNFSFILVISCGQCFPTSISTCDASGMWVSDVSYFPPREGCKFDLGLSGVEGMSCEEATSAIFAASSEYPEYPVTNVLCLKETDTLPSDDDLERYLVITDGNGAALKVVYNRATDCPAKSPLLTKNSPVPTQQCKGTCTYTYESFDVANATCETTDRCYCDGSGEWICESVFNCMSTFPVGSDAIMFSLCPDLSILARPVVEYPRKFCSTNEPCTFVYKSSIPEAMCENTDTCTCSGGDWDCRNVTECVADQKPFTIDCPAESPATSNTTVCDYAHQLSPCTFKYLSSVAVVLCENIDICICTSTNEWQCQRQIQCTDPSPAIACPAEPPAGDEVACDDEHQIQPCNYTYATTISGGTCQNTDFCVCGSLTGYWNCQNSLKCVNDTKGLI